jgi:putative ABC transport system permease protein
VRRLLNHLRSRRDRLEHDLDRELEYHLYRRIAELAAQGVSEPEARRRATVEIGGLTRVRDAVRETWTWPTLDAWALDLRYAIRGLTRNRGFALGVGAVLTLALAANIAVFSVVNAVLIRPLPYPDADRIVSIETLWTNTGLTSQDVSGPDYRDWEAQSDVFDAMAAIYGYDDGPLVIEDRAVFANVRYVSAGFFTVFGQSAAAGRLLNEQDIPAGADEDGDGRIDPETALPSVAVVAHDWATAHFGSAHAAIGKKIAVDGNAEIVGVAAPGFGYPRSADFWIPWGTELGGDDRSDHNYHAVGRLKRGVPLSRAQAQIRTIADVLAQQYPENRLKSAVLVPLQERLTGPVRSTLWLLMAASGAVLLIACANIAGLLLARATERAREMAVRAALGAGGIRVARQLLMEGGALVVVSGAAGFLLAWVLARLALALSPIALISADGSLLDARVPLFAVGVSLLALLFFGVVPALRASRSDLMDALRGGSKLIVSGGSRLRSMLVIAEVALSVVLLVSGGLLLRSFVLLQQVELGFTTDRVVLAYMQYDVYEAELERQQRELRERTAFYVELLERLRNVPGVSAAAGITFLPMGSGEMRPARDMFVQGQPAGQFGERPQAEFYAITPGYFATLEIPLRAGRDFADTDRRESPMVAIVNETFARTILGGESALGRYVRWNERGEWMQIVGVVGDTRWQNPALPAPPTFFVSSLQGWGTSLSLAARTSLDEQTLASALGSLIRELKPTVPVRLESLDDRFEAELQQPRFVALVVGGFSALAALLSGVGLFSVLAYMVGQRRRELAVRQALGAQAVDILATIVGQGVRLAAVGLLVGLAVTVGVMRLLQGLLFEISPWDPATYAIAAAVLGVAALFATILPALKAAAIAPTTALQQE